MNRVVITGAGQVSPLGTGLDEFFKNLDAGKRATNEISVFNSNLFPTKFGGEAQKDDKVLLRAGEIDRKAEFINTALEELLSDNTEINKYAPENRIAHFGAGIDYFDLVSYVDSLKYINGEW